MESNQYLPPALPVVSDVALLKLKRTYEAVLNQRATEWSSTGSDGGRQLEEAVSAIEEELHARGIEAEPWWVARRTQLERPPRRIQHGPPAVRQPSDGHLP